MEVSLRLFRAGGIDHIMSVVSSSVLSQFGCVVTLRQAASCCQCSLCANGSSSRYHGGLGVLHWCFYSVVLILVLCVTVSDVQGSAFSAAKKKKKKAWRYQEVAWRHKELPSVTYSKAMVQTDCTYLKKSEWCSVC